MLFNLQQAEGIRGTAVSRRGRPSCSDLSPSSSARIQECIHAGLARAERRLRVRWTRNCSTAALWS